MYMGASYGTLINEDFNTIKIIPFPGFIFAEVHLKLQYE